MRPTFGILSPRAHGTRSSERVVAEPFRLAAQTLLSSEGRLPLLATERTNRASRTMSGFREADRKGRSAAVRSGLPHLPVASAGFSPIEAPISATMMLSLSRRRI
jgi:hypothetical protein